jgi:ubiquinol-cytochrome c reductase cytochrome b subunit
MAEHPVSVTAGEKEVNRDKGRIYRFFPEHLVKSSVAFAVVFLVILLLSIFAEVPREEIAGTIDEAYLPRPEWYYMWLFQLLTFFSGSTEAIGSLAIPLSIGAILFALPFLSRVSLRGIADRPLATAIGVSSLIGLVFLTLMGFAGARIYGEIVLVPDRELTTNEKKGLHVFVDRDCAYCHHILGKGGRREGPDLSNVIAKGRTKDWLVKLIREPKAISKWTTMPKYDLSEDELNALAAFILSLDFKTYESKTIYREDIIKDVARGSKGS